MLANITVWLSLIIVALIAYGIYKVVKFFKKEKFTMSLHRPQNITSTGRRYNLQNGMGRY